MKFEDLVGMIATNRDVQVGKVVDTLRESASVVIEDDEGIRIVCVRGLRFTSSAVMALLVDPDDEDEDDDDDTAGPNSMQFFRALPLGGKWATLKDLALWLKYDYDPVQKRAARLKRELGRLIDVEQRGRVNYYRVNTYYRKLHACR